MTPPLLARVEVFHFRHQLSRAIPSTMGDVTSRPCILVRLEDTEGAFGWGEIWCNFPPDGDLHRVRLAQNVLPAALAGLSSDLTQSPFRRIAQRLHRIALQAGEIGPVVQIAAGLDIAIHDLASRRSNQSLARFMGAEKTSVLAYASGISPDAYEGQIARMRALGYDHFKQRVGFGADDSLGQAEAAAAGLGADERIMFDANQAWDLPTAIKQAARLGRLSPLFLEEPMPADTPVADWVALAQACTLDIAAGENMRTQPEFDNFLASGALSVFQPDVCKWGGMSACLALAKQVLAQDRSYFPHYLGGGVGLMASAHLLAAAGGSGRLEVDSSENPLMTHFTPAGLGLVDGRFHLPDAAGLGFTPDTAGAADSLMSRSEILVNHA
ncbi:mandelate racemase/muconate lactonizing enzyme family protein [Cognatishimia sp. SS12]|nr:mandelate racemase/muconate lactonizing enzyme family protein [Cognatishimia sp. SS12]